MFTTDKLREFETEIMSNALRQMHELNPERIKDWSKWFQDLRETTQDLLVAQDLLITSYCDPRTPLPNPAVHANLKRLQAMIDRAQELFLGQLTTFIMFELPQWVSQEIAREFPNKIGERFAASLRDVSLDGFVSKDPLGDTAREVKDLIA